MTYYDVFAAAVPTEKKQDYIEHCRRVGPVFKKYGALNYVECWGDEVPEGETTSFPMAVKAQKGETVAVGWVIWPSKAVRDEGMAKVMEDPDMKSEIMPMDGKRLIYGGFEEILTE